MATLGEAKAWREVEEDIGEASEATTEATGKKMPSITRTNAGDKGTPKCPSGKINITAIFPLSSFMVSAESATEQDPYIVTE